MSSFQISSPVSGEVAPSCGVGGGVMHPFRRLPPPPLRGTSPETGEEKESR